MDVSNILAVEAPAFLAAAWVLTGVFTVLAALFAVLHKTRKAPDRYAIICTVLAVAGMLTAGVTDFNTDAARQNMLEAALFETYGATTGATGGSWTMVERAGDAGTVSKLTIDGQENKVLIRLEGSRLTVIGDDGQELPANPGR